MQSFSAAKVIDNAGSHKVNAYPIVFTSN